MAENPVPALSISGPAAKNPATANRKIRLRAGDREYSSSLGRNLGKLQVVCSSQTMLCLFIVEVSSQLASPSLPQDRNNGQPGSWGENQLHFSDVSPPLILVCLSTISLFQQPRAKCCYRRSTAASCPARQQCCAAEGVGCLSHLDRSCRETGGRMRFMFFPVKISLHSSFPLGLFSHPHNVHYRASLVFGWKCFLVVREIIH